ncbi:winged helix-turn-helix transcriptional regulator [Saccharothrix sp. AJ9571]|nr:winged helix-turn-helix transcriptional regulator [Saccharothrix sp. AJ9571]
MSLVEGWDVPYQRELNDALDVLRRRWTVAVLAALAGRKRQYTDLLTAINEIEQRASGKGTSARLSDRVLTDTLRRAREDGLINREAEPGNFGAVWYRLTPAGRELLRALRPLLAWSREHRLRPR